MSRECKAVKERLDEILVETDNESAAQKIFDYIRGAMLKLDAEGFRYAIEVIKDHAMKNDAFKPIAIDALTMLNDRRYNTGNIKRGSMQHVLKINLDAIFAATPMITEKTNSQFCQIDFSTRSKLRKPATR